MAPQLPVELLRLIVDDLRTLFGLQKIRSELRSLCLTSKTFCAIAQPLLFTFASFEEEDALEVLKKLVTRSSIDRGLLSLVRRAVFTYHFERFEDELEAFDEDVDVDWRLRVDPEELPEWFELSCKLATSATRLECLVLTSDYVDFELFNRSSLRILHLDDMLFPEESLASASFPLLECLSIHNVFLPDDGLPSYAFPSLRHLAFADDYSRSWLHHMLPTLRSFGNQLDSICLPLDFTTDMLRDLPPPRLDAILCAADSNADSRPNFLPQAHIVNFRLDVSSTDAAVKYIKRVASYLRKPHKLQRLETMFLRPLYSLPEDCRNHERLMHSLDKILSRCRKRGVRVVFDGELDEYRDFDGFLSRTLIDASFANWRTQKRLEKEVAVEAE